MSKFSSSRLATLARREIQESRNSLFWAPVWIAVGLIVTMLLSVLLAGRISAVGDTMLQVLLQEESASGTNISIRIDGGSDGNSSSYKVERRQGPVTEEDWDFSSDRESDPKAGTGLQEELQEELDERVGNLNPILNVVHNLLLLVLFMVSISYLLASLFNDRRDQSILFWRSMPVSEWEEVLSKFVVAIVIVPVIYIVVSIVLQIAYILVAMLLVWRLEMNPFELVIGNIDFISLWFNQIAGWILTALWLAPIYAWLLLASAAAKRSPFMMAVAPLLALVLLERVFLGSDFLTTAVGNHIPHYEGGVGSLGFYLEGPDWASINFLDGFLGLLFAAAALAAAVYLRRYRFEI
jgi:hypothetical protein